MERINDYDYYRTLHNLSNKRWEPLVKHRFRRLRAHSGRSLRSVNTTYNQVLRLGQSLTDNNRQPVNRRKPNDTISPLGAIAENGRHIRHKRRGSHT